MLPVVEATASYKAPARYDDVLLVRTQVSELKRASLAFTYELRREDDPATLLCTGRTLHACTDPRGPAHAPPRSLLLLLRPVP